MEKIIKPGTVVVDKNANVNYGMMMNVIDDTTEQAMVAYINLDGIYQENWVDKTQLYIVENADESPIFPCKR